MPANDLCALSLSEVASRIQKRQVSAVEVTEANLARIEQLDSTLNSFITVTTEQALAQAGAADAEIGKGNYRGPLHGVPVSLKDLFDTRGVRTTGGSRVLANNVPESDATAVRKLDSAGAVLLGKNNMLEFAYGEIHPDYGPSRNPWNPDYGTAGSSSGSGAAVAAGLGYASLGSDTGGSIRGPAAFCGVVGIKPTYGLVSRAGGFPLSWSLDHMGPLTRTVRDNALILDAIAGVDPNDPGSRRAPWTSIAATLDEPLNRVRVGIVQPAEGDGVVPSVLRSIENAESVLRSHGVDTVPVDLPLPEQAARVLMAILYAEASSIHRPWLKSHAADYSDPVRERLELGGLLPASIYLSAQRARAAIVEVYRELFRTIDFLVLPVSAVPCYRIDAPKVPPIGTEGDRMKAGIRFEGPFNVTGQPAMSIPGGATDEGLPIGVQLVGRPFSEPELYRVALLLEDGLRSELPQRSGNQFLC